MNEPPPILPWPRGMSLRRLNQQFPGYACKEAALNPTNPKNLADDFERRIIDQYRAGARSGEASGIEGEGLRRAVYVARPFTIRNPQCLACHGEPKDAPATMTAFYGAERGFGWRLNETIGILIVRADQALYAAKQGGRNRVVAAESPAP